MAQIVPDSLFIYSRYFKMVNSVTMIHYGVTMVIYHRDPQRVNILPDGENLPTGSGALSNHVGSHQIPTFPTVFHPYLLDAGILFHAI